MGGGLVMDGVAISNDALFAEVFHYEKLEGGTMLATATTAPIAVQRWMVMGMRMFRKRKPYGDYPACDHLNVALRYLLCSADENCIPIEEIVYAITKSNGYIYDDVKNDLEQNNILWYGERKDNA